MEIRGQSAFAAVVRGVARHAHWYGPALIGLFLLQALWMRFTLGHWPVVYRDVAEGPVAVALEALTSWSVVGLIVGSPVLFLLLLASWALYGPRRAVIQATVLVACAALLVAAVVVNPVGFPEWWLD